MDIVTIEPSGSLPNCTRHMMIPSSADYFKYMSAGNLVVIGLLGAVTAADIALYVEQMAFFITNRKYWKPRDKAKWIIAVYPLMSATSFGALVVPRSSYMADTVTSIYISVIVYLFVTMLIGHFGGAEKMVARLVGYTVRFNTQPICCCCTCLPVEPVSAPLLRKLEIMVLQFALARPILAYILTVAYSDQNYGAEAVATSPSTWLGTINTLSSVTAMWGLSIIFSISRIPLQNVSVKPKFICMQLVIMIGGLQKAIIGLFVVSGVMPCHGLLSRQANGDRWNHMIIIVEAMILSVVARHYYRKHVGDNPNDRLTPSEQVTNSPSQPLLDAGGEYDSGDSIYDSHSFSYQDPQTTAYVSSSGEQQVRRQPSYVTGLPSEDRNRGARETESVKVSHTGYGSNDPLTDALALHLNADQGQSNA